MAWFGSSSSSSSSSSNAPAGSPGSIPDRSSREQCWQGRDAYFGCLDKNNVQVPGQEQGSTCQGENDMYRKHCAASWVDYFNKRRVLQLRQDMMQAKAAAQMQEGGITGAKS